MKCLIIWDIDGTLMDCQGIGRKALNLSLEALYDISKGFDKINFSGTIDKQIIEDAKALHALQRFDEEKFWIIYEKILKEEIQKNPHIRMFKGVQSLLERLNQEPSVYHILSTGNAKVGAWVKLNWTRLAPYFQHGAYGDEVRNRTELVALAIERAKEVFCEDFSLDRIYVVGDTPLDIEAAKVNGVISVAVATGRFSQEALAAFEPHFVFENFHNTQDFIDLLQLHT